MYFNRLLFILLCTCWCSLCSSWGNWLHAQSQKIPLHEGWQFQQKGQKEWLPATVPGNVQYDLMQNKLLEDPFYRDNETKIQWVQDKHWIYQNTFQVTDSLLANDHLELVFEGLDTYAKVWLNGVVILEANNFHRSWEVDVKPFLKTGDNTLKIRFYPPLKTVKRYWRKLGYKLPGGPQVMIRKPGFHFGWDWGPKIITAGIWRPVYLHAWQCARLEEFQIQTDLTTPGVAQVKANILVNSTEERAVQFKVNIAGKSYILSGEKLQPGRQWKLVQMTIQDPKLWWPNGMGEQHLEIASVALVEHGVVLDQIEKRFGFRTIELVQDPDSLGKSFYFKVNGQPVFMKGANYIPQDNLQNRVKPQHYRHLLQQAQKANMNMLRVWSGGIYEAATFYDLCDEYGLLVWQDFMYACAMYPGDEAFLNNASREAAEQVKRLRHHPCIALWCGNNESSEGWHRWGWQNGLRPKQREKVWKGYQDLFQGILPETVKAHHPEAPYWESSPMLGRGDPQHQFMGDAHYWGVWHDAEPFHVLEEKVPRFMSEFGFQSYPEFKTIQAFTDSTDWDTGSVVMKVHQKHIRGLQLVTDYMQRWYRAPKDFQSFLYVSQVLQAEGMKVGLEAHRRSMPYCMGTLYWQLNDCWPVASWSSIDYYSRWKALHYTVKKVYEPIILSAYDAKPGLMQVYAVVEGKLPLQGILTLNAISFSGDTIYSKEIPVKMEANTTKLLLERSHDFLAQQHPKGQLVVVAQLWSSGKEYEIARELHYLVKPKDLALSQPKIEFRVKRVPDGYLIRLHSDKLAKNVRLSSKYNGHFSDNYFDLLPGEFYKVVYHTDRPIPAFEQSLQVFSLWDSFEDK